MSLTSTWYGNSLSAWLGALTSALATLLIIALVRFVLRRRLTKAKQTATDLDDFFLDLANRTLLFLLFFPALHLVLRSLELPPRADAVTRALAVIGTLIQAGIWSGAVTDFWLNRYKRSADPGAMTAISALSMFVKGTFWVVVTLMALANLGVEVTTLIAGLGVGGVAVALALQKILGDLFASLSIVIDKPFVIGDTITVGDQVGTVEYVGLKTTRLRSIWGEQVIFSNAQLLESRVHNMQRLRERRVLLSFGVVYQTPRELLERIPSLIREVVGAQPLARFDRAHLKRLGDSSIEFEAVYFVLSGEYNVLMDVQHAANLQLLARLDGEGITLAYPTRTLFVSGRQHADQAVS